MSGETGVTGTRSPTGGTGTSSDVARTSSATTVATTVETTWRSPKGWSPPVQAIAAVAAALAAWAVAAALFNDGLPPGILVRGLVVGSLYALNAIGLVLVYRANKVINFAQAEFGSVAAVIAVVLVVHHSWGYVPAVLLGLVLAVISGIVLERAVIRRFADAPRLILAVATIALAQLLAGIAIVIPLLYDDLGEGRFEVPWDITFTIDPVTFNTSYVLALVLVPIVAIALGAFLRRTRYGLAIRGAAENGERASLLGVPIARLSTIVWAIAAFLSALAVLLRVSIVGFSSFSSVSGGGSILLLFTLAAAVVGRMESLPRTVAAALVLGVFEEAMVWNYSNTTVVEALLVVVILVALLLQRDVMSRALDTGIATWDAMREGRTVPAEVRRHPEVRVVTWLVRIVLVAAAAALPLVARPSQENALTLVLIYAVVAVSLVVLTGWAGHISLGQFALAGFGGATTAVLYGRHDVDILVATAAGVIVAGGVALVLGLPALRVRGPFLAVTTLAFAITSYSYFLNSQYFDWFVEPVISRPEILGFIPIDEDWQMYELCLVGLILVLWGARNLRASRFGRVLLATRDNASAAEAVTINTTSSNLAAFAVSGMIAGFAGALYVLQQTGLHTDAFQAPVSLKLFSMVVIGGLTSLGGAVLGAVYVRGAEFFLPAGWDLLVSGLGVLVLLMVLPRGLSSLIYWVRDRYVDNVVKRRHIEVPMPTAGPSGGDSEVLEEALARMRETGAADRDVEVPA